MFCYSGTFFINWCGLCSEGSISCGCNEQIQKSFGEKGTAWPLWESERLDPCLDRLLLLSNSIHTSKKVFIHYAHVCFRWLLFRDNKGKDVTDYFLQIIKEQMLQMQGNGKSDWSGYTPFLGELAHTSGSYLKIFSICCFNSGWGSFSKSKPQSSLGIMQAWFPTRKPICGFGSCVPTHTS